MYGSFYMLFCDYDNNFIGLKLIRKVCCFSVTLTFANSKIIKCDMANIIFKDQATECKLNVKAFRDRVYIKYMNQPRTHPTHNFIHQKQFFLSVGLTFLLNKKERTQRRKKTTTLNPCYIRPISFSIQLHVVLARKKRK